MTHSLDIAIRSTHAISRIRGEDFPTPDSLFHTPNRTPNPRTSVGPNANVDAHELGALPARRPGRPARDGVERCPATAPLDAQNRASIRKILTRLGWDQSTPLVAVVDGCEAVVSVGVPDRPTLAKVRVDRDGRLTLPAKVLAALDLVPGEYVLVVGAPAEGRLYLAAAADVLQALFSAEDAGPAPAVVTEIAIAGRRTRVRPAFEYTGVP